MKVPFTWKVTGWFVLGWSLELPVGEVRPLRYFGEDLVAYRDESGELFVWHQPHGEPPLDVVSRVEKRFLVTVWEDLEVWRYLEYVERPPLSKVDAEPYFALRTWAQQFYDVPA